MRLSLRLLGAGSLSLSAVLGSACGGVVSVTQGTQGNPDSGTAAAEGGRAQDAGVGDVTTAGGCMGSGACKCGTPVCASGQWVCPGGCGADGGAAFCSGAAPRLSVNGAEVSVLDVKGKAFALNCCDSAEVTVASAMFQSSLVFYWRVPAASSGPIDLGSPPSGTTLELDLGCDPAVMTCGAGAEDRYTTGFQGTLETTPNATGLDASYCVSVGEPGGNPHPVIHSLQLYAPHVASNY